MEIKRIEGYNNYFVSKDGLVLREVKGNLDSYGYPNVCLYKNKIKKSILTHRLVAKAFIENSQNKETVNHKNGIKKDNRVENLEWMTRSENSRHAFKLGLLKSNLPK